MTVNPGSSGLKLGVYRQEGSRLDCLCKGAIDGVLPGRLRITTIQSIGDYALSQSDIRHALPDIIALLCRAAGIDRIDATGHRIVHGGHRFAGPVLINDSVMASVAALVPLAPLHQPRSLMMLAALRDLHPDMPQTASFDTAFHQTQSAQARRLALPRALHDAGIRRYGFHGLSYEYVAQELRRRAPALAAGCIVVTHLGSGVSLCALKNGRSQDCSMGFSTLDGIPMATRSGRLDPGVLLHMIKTENRPLSEVEDILYHQSGLFGLSGISGDMRDLVASGRPEAHEAVAIFCLAVAREITSQATALGGLDGIVFTAGIGEHMPEIRREICGHLAWLGIRLEETENTDQAFRISTADSRAACLVIPTDEEIIIARQACSLLWP